MRACYGYPRCEVVRFQGSRIRREYPGTIFIDSAPVAAVGFRFTATATNMVVTVEDSVPVVIVSDIEEL